MNHTPDIEPESQSKAQTGDWLDKLRPTTAVPPDEPNEIAQDAPKEDVELITDEANPGAMPADARRALVSLLRHGVILANDRNKLYESLCRYQSKVRHFLADVYLQLVLDEKAGVAFVASIEPGDESLEEGEEVISLINKRTLSLYDTLVLLILRKHYQERETAGEQRIIIDADKVESHLTPFLPLINSERKARDQLNAALKRCKDKRILNTVRGSEERFEITPVIRYVVNADFLEKLLAEYLKLANQNGEYLEVQVEAQAEVSAQIKGEPNE
jgi:hypothetical protein